MLIKKNMAKKITKKLKLQIPAGKANPAPPVGPALGQAGINIGDFVQKFNADTGEQYVAGKHVLSIVGKYEFKWFAHCKCVEMWIELCKV